MRRALAPLSIGLLASGLLAQSSPADGDAPPASFAVVELFTSQGCHSCPPADALAAELAAAADTRDRPVYVLAFHVDYWDTLGWPDPFSSVHATLRQQAYALHWRASNVYTPQMVVNGTTGFVGSDRGRAAREIDAAVARPAEVSLTAEAAREGDRVRIAAEVAGADGRELVLVAAVVEGGLVTDIPRGENRGKTLRQENVVRAFEVVPVSGGRAAASLTVPDGVHWARAGVIVYAQHKATLEIVGAARVDSRLIPRAE